MTTVPANAVRIPAAAREALARREAVMVLSHGRPAYVIVSPDAYEAASQPPAPSIPRGRKLGELLDFFATAPAPDPGFADDIEAIQASVGDEPLDPWEHS
jgi:hypothetical protein